MNGEDNPTFELPLNPPSGCAKLPLLKALFALYERSTAREQNMTYSLVEVTGQTLWDIEDLGFTGGAIQANRVVTGGEVAADVHILVYFEDGTNQAWGGFYRYFPDGEVMTHVNQEGRLDQGNNLREGDQQKLKKVIWDNILQGVFENEIDFKEIFGSFSGPRMKINVRRGFGPSQNFRGEFYRGFNSTNT